MRMKTNPDAVALFWNLAAELMSEHRGVVEGTTNILADRLKRLESSGLIVKEADGNASS